MMSEYPYYDWIGESIDDTIAEAEDLMALNEKLKKSEEIEKYFYYFPPHMIKNPAASFYLPLECSDPHASYSLQVPLSEN